jgi:hypothetical protein
MATSGYMAMSRGRIVTAITCAQIVGRTVAILADNRGGNRVIDLLSGAAISSDHIGDGMLNVRPTLASALIVVGGLLLEVRGGEGGTITVVQDKSTNLMLGQHDGGVTAIACAYLDGRPVAFTGGEDGIVRVWDLLDRKLLDAIAVLGPVFAIWPTSHGELVIGAGGEALAFTHANAHAQPSGDPA